MPIDEFTPRISFLVGLFVGLPLFVSWYFRRDPMLAAIPTVGFSDPILSYFSAFRFIFDGTRMLKKGYEKTRPGLFKIANAKGWTVLVTGSKLIDDVRKAPEDVLSAAPSFEFNEPKYTLDLLDSSDMYQTDIIRTKLTRNIASTFNEVREEFIMALDDLIPTHEDEWIKVPILETIQRVICRATNRVFVGVPLCRDHDYQTLNLDFTVNVFKLALIIGLFPKPLKPIVSGMISILPSQIRQEIEFIRPMVEERFAKMDEYGEDWDDKPNDLLMWLMSEAKGVERSLEGVARRMLLVNFVSIHATSLTLTLVLYRLLANPEYIEPLREEVDAVIREEGWTKAGIDKMHKMDSFLKESQRLDNLTLLGPTRLTERPFTFSNGMTIPAGVVIAVPTSETHRDEITYSNPDEFDGFRSVKLRENGGDETTGKYQAISSSNEHIPFGLGRHICPGRYFAANEIKSLVAYIITTYDIKLGEGQRVPRDYGAVGMRLFFTGNVMFRARQK